MNDNLAISLQRGDELLQELTNEYNKSLTQKEVSTRAVQLTHEICERLRSVLDRLARAYWERFVSPQLTPTDQQKAKIYFPIRTKQDDFDAALGQWHWKTVRGYHQPLYDYLLSLQPFQGPSQKWLSILDDLAVKGKHIDLVPQKRFEDGQITVTGQRGGSVAYSTSGVFFGSGVYIMGAPVDVRTQRIVPTPGLTERLEKWVSFVISGHDVNALGFCQQACKETRQIAEQMSTRFGLA
jgi:hypothetical protein